MKQAISTADWSDAWSEDTPVEVEFGDGSKAYLGTEAAVARLADDFGSAEAVRLMLGAGQPPLIRFNGSRYVVLTAAPITATED